MEGAEWVGRRKGQGVRDEIAVFGEEVHERLMLIITS